MSAPSLSTDEASPAPFTRPSDLRTMLLIAQRGAIESLRDRMTLGFNLFFSLLFPVGMVAGIISRQAEALIAGGRTEVVGTTLAIYLLTIGLVPATGALGAEAVYLTSPALFGGADKLSLLPTGLSLGLVALIPAVAIFAAGVASLISSRVRSFNSAQQLGGLALFPFWGGIFILTLKLQDWGNLALVATIVGLFAADILLITLAAATWRREEVLAQR
jgi:hypothetical protein